MTDVLFSAEQILAIETRGENLLVAAGAGSGKTTVLVERLIHSLADTENQGSLQRMLVLTFTNAAAADMRGKIDRALNKLVSQNPDNRHLIKELAQLPQASISTIHSFCLDLLRRHYYRIDLDAGFRIARDMELTLMAEEVLERFMEEQYAKENGLAAALADAYGGNRDDRDLLKLINELYRFSRSQADPEQWLNQVCSAYDPQDTLDEYSFIPYLRQWLCSEIAYTRQCFGEAHQIILGDNIPLKWREALNTEIAMIDELLAYQGNAASFINNICACKFATLRLSKKDEDVNKDTARMEFKQKRDKGRTAFKDLQKKYTAVDGQRLLDDLHLLAPLMRGLGELVIGYGRELAKEKRLHNLIDFADMEHMALQLLRMEDIAEELRNGFDEVLIDEYQDINAVQEEILRLLQNGDNCFAVGDVKQSIYRFRLAEPELFLGKYLAYGDLIGGRRIVLNKNYRSRGNIIDAVNYIFRQLMSVPIAEMDYDDAASLKAGRLEQGESTEFVLIDIGKDGFTVADKVNPDSDDKIKDSGEDNSIANEIEDKSVDKEDISAIEAEARFIGKRINELVEDYQYDYGDIAILLRSVKVKERVIAEQLSAMGIPVITDKQDSFLDSVEIGLMLSLLKIIDNPRQDMPLAAVLRSPIGGFTADQLLEIRLNAPIEVGKKDFFAAVTAYAATVGELAQRLSDFLSRLDKWRELSRRERVSVLIWQIWRDSGYYHLVGALVGGERRQANLQALYSQACEYEAQSYAGLYRFIRYLEQAKEKGIELAAAKSSGGLSAVRVMSIHRSKGLEFPVVFVAGLGSRFHAPTDNQDIIWHKELGLGPKIADRDKRIKYPSLAYQAVAARLAAEMAAEELRILYVALTRARDKLILTAAIRNLEQSLNSWGETGQNEQIVLPPAYLKRDKRPVDWLGRVLFRHQDAQILRDNAVSLSKQLPGEGAWQISIISGSLMAAPLQTEQKGDNDMLVPEIEPELKHQVAKNLDWRYPWGDICAYPAKWTVSELIKSAYPPELAAEAARQLPALPAQRYSVEDGEQRQEQQQKAARRGTVNHLLLEKLDWSQSVAEQVVKFTEQGLLTADDAALANIAMIERFSASRLGQRLAKAVRLEREVAFTYAIAAKEKNVAAADDDMLMVQGVLDVAFWEDDGWVLVDYKTGGRGKTEQQIINIYSEQLHYYRRAIEQLWRQSVKEIYLYMLDWPKTIRVE